LQEVQALLKLFHGAIERGSEKVDVQSPRMSGIVDADADTILSGLIAFDTAAVFVAGGGSSSRHVSFTDLRSQGWMILIAVRSPNCGRKEPDLCLETLRGKVRFPGRPP
jgi:hypothetical protein